MSTEVNDCAPGSKLGRLNKNPRAAVRLNSDVFRGGFAAVMKTGLVLIAFGNMQRDRRPELRGGLLQPVAVIFRRKPATVGSGRRMRRELFRDLAAKNHVLTIGRRRGLLQPFFGKKMAIFVKKNMGGAQSVGTKIHNAARTSAACSSGFTNGQIFLILPSGPMRNVTRLVPMYFRPMKLFSPQTP